MKIYGIGADIVKVKRFKKLINNKLFLKKIFSNYEITRCKKIKNSFNCFAKRFAAKEAFSKALGTGISTGIIFNEIVVLNESSGKPFIKLMNNTKKIVDKRLKKKNIKFLFLYQMKIVMQSHL